MLPSGSSRGSAGRPVDEARLHAARQQRVPVGHRQDVLHRALHRRVGGVERLLPVPVVRGNRHLGGRRHHQREPERREQRERQHGHDQRRAALAASVSVRRQALHLSSRSSPEVQVARRHAEDDRLVGHEAVARPALPGRWRTAARPAPAAPTRRSGSGAGPRSAGCAAGRRRSGWGSPSSGHHGPSVSCPCASGTSAPAAPSDGRRETCCPDGRVDREGAVLPGRPGVTPRSPRRARAAWARTSSRAPPGR